MPGSRLKTHELTFRLSGVASPATASSVYVIEIVHNGEVVVRTKRSFGDPELH
jgi:hypothetical protein